MRDEKTERMERVLEEFPLIGRGKLAEKANVSQRAAMEFLKSRKEGDDPSPIVRHLRDQVNMLQTELHAEQAARGELQNLLNQVLDTVTVAKPVKIDYTKPRKGRKVSHQCCSVLHCSDWHIGKSVIKEDIEEWGEFNYEIAKARLERLVQYKVDTVEMERQSIVVNDLVILSTGDMINGSLRPADRATNEFPLCVQPVKAAELWSAVIMAFAPHFRKVYVEWVVPDNHGRISKKIEHTEPWNSYNYLVAELAKAKTAKQDNVDWHIYPGETGIVEVQGRKYLIRHGHGMTGSSYAGISWYKYEQSAGREARRRMRRPRPYQFDRIITGHLHAPVRARDWWIGGSLSGTDNFDHHNGRESEPLQTGWLVHPRHGEINYNEYNLLEVK